MKYLSGFVLFILLNYQVYAQQHKVCITVDDLPVVNYGIQDIDYLRGITRDLITTFDNYQIPAIGFLNETKLYRSGKLDTARVDLLAMWLTNGYELGNHSYSHHNYHQVGYEIFTQDILKGEQVTRPIIEQSGRSLKYFRHPYLRVGLTKYAHDSLTQFLEQHKYVEAPVTIDNDDYLFAKAYHDTRLKGDTALMQKIGQDYVQYMEYKLLWFEDMSDSLFSRNISHILLIHANKINADYLDELAAMYQSHGYQFVTLAEALEDKAYQHPITRYGDWGISWLDRWALTQGKKGAFFAGDPPTPTYIKEILK